MIPVRVRLLVLTCLLTVLLADDAAAQAIQGWLQKSFMAERIDADRIRLAREVEIEGEAGTPQAGQKFFADDLEMNTKTGELTARGNVVFQTPTAQISADSVVFNTKTSVGTFHNASGIAQLGERGARNQSMFGTLEPDVYFYGVEIEKIASDKYRIKKGGFTTCVQPTPRWEIVSGSATLRLDHYVMLRNAIVEVKDVPVFYLPMLYYPIQEDDRATGFLLPMYGSSLATGSSISNAFFWAINRSQDATFFHDWMFSRGNGLGTEYRYLLAPQAQGDIRYYWLGKGAINSNQAFERLLDEILPGIKSWSVNVREPHVEVLGPDAAVVSFLTDAGASTYVFERRNAQWKIINIHESEPLPTARSPDAPPGDAIEGR